VARKPWEQLDNESNAAYARFLAYRNLGPLRTLQKAYETHQACQPAKNRNKSQAPTGAWTDDSTAYNWKERATAWDVANLLQEGEQAATLYVGAMRKHARKVYESLDQLEPERYDDAIKGLELLAKLFPPDVLASLISNKHTETGHE
jgi:hypothetical protein